MGCVDVVIGELLVVLVGMFIVEVVLTVDVVLVFIPAMIWLIAFFTSVFNCSFFIRSDSLLNISCHADLLLSTICFSGVLFQLNDRNPMFVAQAHKIRIVAPNTVTSIQSHRFAARCALDWGGSWNGIGSGIDCFFLLGINHDTRYTQHDKCILMHVPWIMVVILFLEQLILFRPVASLFS